MARAHLDGPAHRICVALRQLGAYFVIGGALVLSALWGLFLTTGEDHRIMGTVVRIEQTGTRSLSARAVVRLNDGQVTVALPSRTSCRTGSAIELIRRDNKAGRSFRAALAACREQVRGQPLGGK
ncbi:hypothetical protein [Sphingopyxis sp. 113P3]|uniref:hypothetical protein n=1 Tax=Sphingopyxis sp. (strain 113P3) TaxID=292913 RepID=UPI0006AD57F5|nr:hypothetical protein [Sphingopyxis sp. 113P3]